MKTETKSISRLEIFLRALLFCVLVFLFLVAVKMFGAAANQMTENSEFVASLLKNLGNPFVSLSLGIFLTAIMQSSSATTSIAVAMVATGTITVPQAVPFVMGANIGTSITSTIVALGHIGERKTFSRAYSAGALQDMFNLMTTSVMLPLEIAFGVLSKTAEYLVNFLPAGSSGGGESWNPLPWMVSLPVKVVESGLASVASTTVVSILMMILGLTILFFALIHITKNMKVLMEARIEELLNRVLSKNGLLGIIIGIAVTMIIQSSSITTSLLVPLVASGVLKLETIYPILIGANVGTTITALLAAMAYTGGAGGAAALQLALVHFLFNFSGLMLYYPIPWMRFPVRGAKYLSNLALQSRKFVITWILIVFFFVPIFGIWFFS